MKTAVIGLSGGVDSAVSAYLLQQEGYRVIGVTVDTGFSGNTPLEAKRVAEELGIEHHIVDASEDFRREVVEPFAEAYRQARTPNPCCRCNPRVKWKVLLDEANRLGADIIATGHYGKIVRLENGRYTVEKAPYKDQSYVLYGLSQEMLSRTRTMLSGLTKDEVRRIAAERGLINAEAPDSQEICFIPDNDHASFIERLSGEKAKEGNFITPAGEVLGRHKGLIHYTIGQRKGLGIALGEPRFVTELRAGTNEVVLGSNEDCFKDGLLAAEPNWLMTEGPAPGEEVQLLGKVRYAQTEEPCRIRLRGDGLVECIFEHPQRAVTPGQAVVWYRDGMVYGGATITEGFRLTERPEMHGGEDNSHSPRRWQDKLCDWFDANAVSYPWREDPTPYHVWLSEVMLQQTRLETVRPYYERFLASFPTVEALAASSEEEVFKAWEGLGYYTRARNLMKTAGIIASRCNGRFPEDAAELSKLPGIGVYTAGAISAVAFGRPAIAIDGNVLRVVSRLFELDGDVMKPASRTKVESILRDGYPTDRPSAFVQGLMELGETKCQPKKLDCEGCPLKEDCKARRSGRASELPLRQARTEKKTERRTLLMIERGGKLLLHRRPSKGVLAGLWEIPAAEDGLDALKTVSKGEVLGETKHVFTHLVWEMTAIRAELPDDAEPADEPDFYWASDEELSEKLMLPTAFQKLINLRNEVRKEK